MASICKKCSSKPKIMYAMVLFEHKIMNIRFHDIFNALKKSSYGSMLPTSYTIRVLKEERFLRQYATRMPYVFLDRGSSYRYAGPPPATPYFVISERSSEKRSRKNTATLDLQKCHKPTETSVFYVAQTSNKKGYTGKEKILYTCVLQERKREEKSLYEYGNN